MKNVLFIGLTLFSLHFLSSCNKEEALSTDDALIEEIATSTDKVNVEPTALPIQTRTYIEDSFFESYVESAAVVADKGYEIVLANEDVLYCNRDGEALHARNRRHGRPHRPGPCGQGEPLATTDLPASVTAYITENYPDAEIRRAKTKDGNYLVKVTGHLILIFDSEGTFVSEAPMFRFCRGERIASEDLSAVIVSYITANYPDAEIKVAVEIRNKIAVGILTDDGRKILVFDLDGNFLFERG